MNTTPTSLFRVSDTSDATAYAPPADLDMVHYDAMQSSINDLDDDDIYERIERLIWREEI